MDSEIEERDSTVNQMQDNPIQHFTPMPTITEVSSIAGSQVNFPQSNTETCENEDSKSLSDDQRISVEESAEDDDTLELSDFDWDEFETGFLKELKKIDQEEIQILDQFDRLMEMFFIWAQTGSNCETERATKRVKTRKRFVQLSEASLEKKKAHYVKVVSAFKIALAMLLD